MQFLRSQAQQRPLSPGVNPSNARIQGLHCYANALAAGRNGERNSGHWIARQITEAFPWDEAPRYLIRDQDAIYGTTVARRLRAMGIRDKPIAPGSPWQNGYAERLIGTIRRECLDHLIVLGEAHLRWILGEFVAYYNKSRTHRDLSQDAPVHRAIERLGAITSRRVLGGLHHQYCRI
jgi:transposase InsO family protein